MVFNSRQGSSQEVSGAKLGVEFSPISLNSELCPSRYFWVTQISSSSFDIVLDPVIAGVGTQLTAIFGDEAVEQEGRRMTNQGSSSQEARAHPPFLTNSSSNPDWFSFLSER